MLCWNKKINYDRKTFWPRRDNCYRRRFLYVHKLPSWQLLFAAFAILKKEDLNERMIWHIWFFILLIEQKGVVDLCKIVGHISIHCKLLTESIANASLRYQWFCYVTSYGFCQYLFHFNFKPKGNDAFMSSVVFYCPI